MAETIVDERTTPSPVSAVRPGLRPGKWVPVPDAELATRAQPALCYVARATRGMLIQGSLLSDYFSGPDRWETALQACRRLRAEWPDAGVFYADDQETAQALLAQGMAQQFNGNVGG